MGVLGGYSKCEAQIRTLFLSLSFHFIRLVSPLARRESAPMMEVLEGGLLPALSEQGACAPIPEREILFILFIMKHSLHSLVLFHISVECVLSDSVLHPA